MNCPKCGETLTFTVSVIFSGPMEHFYKLSKTTLRQKDMKLLGVDWDKALILCWNCGLNVFNEKAPPSSGAKRRRNVEATRG